MILVAGEAIIDLIEQPLADGNSVFKWAYGGSPLNVAVGLARLGLPVTYLNAISTDPFGVRLYDHIRSEGVDCRFVVRTNRSSSLAFATLDDSGVPEYAFHLEGSADGSLTATNLPKELPNDITCVHFGSLATVLEPTATTVARFVTQAAENRVVSFDPNIRPSIMSDRAAYRARLDELFPYFDIMKASAEDVLWLYGTKDIEDVVRDWSQMGPHLAIITAGSDGVVAAINGKVVFIPSASVDVVDTIGAGDTFQSLILGQLADNGLLSKHLVRTLRLETLHPILSTAAAAAALTCSRRGADLPRRHEIHFVK